MNENTQTSYLPVPSTFEEAWRLGKVLAASNLVPKDYQGKVENVLVAMQWGLEIGLPGLQALQNISVINGRPSIWGDAAKALVMNSKVCEDIKEFFEGNGPTLTAVCIAKRIGKTEVRQEFSIGDARTAGLLGKAGPWTQYPKRMLQMRARAFALRDAFPDVLRGLALAEEAADMIDMGTADIVETPAPISQPAQKKRTAKSMAVPASIATQSPEPTEEPQPIVEEQQLDILDAVEQPQEATQSETAGVVEYAHQNAINHLLLKAEQKGINEHILCEGFGLESIQKTPANQINRMLEWVRQQEI